MNRPSIVNLDATQNNLAFTYEVNAGDNTLSMQISNPGTATTVTTEISNDGAVWVAHAGIPTGWASAPTAVSTFTTAGIWVFQVQARYFRVRVSTPGTGSVIGVVNAGEGWSR
jgi:phage gp37-like protein